MRHLKRKAGLCIALFLLTSLYTLAQETNLRYGVKGGLNLSTALAIDSRELHIKPGVHIGVTIDYLFSSKFELQSGLFFSQQGSVIDGLNQNSYTGYTSFDAAFTHTYNQLYLQIPLYAAFRINWSDHWSMTIGVGPYIGYGVGGGTMKELIRGVYGDGSTKTKWNTFGNGVYDEDRNYLLGEYLDPFDFGVGVNVNIEYKKYILGAGLESGILNVMNDNDDELSYRNINIRISAGYKF